MSQRFNSRLQQSGNKEIVVPNSATTSCPAPSSPSVIPSPIVSTTTDVQKTEKLVPLTIKPFVPPRRNTAPSVVSSTLFDAYEVELENLLDTLSVIVQRNTAKEYQQEEVTSLEFERLLADLMRNETP